MVDAKFTPGSMKTMIGLDPKTLRARPGGPWVKNVALAGVVPPCGTRDAATGACTVDADDRCTAAGLSCNPTTCLCDVPAVGAGELCAPGFQRCRTDPLDPTEAALAPLGFVCHPAPRGFCIVRCDASAPDMSPEDDLDSRCGNRPGFACVTPGTSATSLDDRKQSVCVRRCMRGDLASERTCAAPLRCQSQRQVTACTLDDGLYPF
jgi:hypothetical protein